MHEGHGRVLVDARGKRIEQPLVNGRIFGECSLPAVVALVVAPDPITRREFRHARTQAFHAANQVASDDERRGERDLKGT